MRKPLLAPRFVGARFDGHSIPLELLKDLAALEEFIIAVAKWKYVLQHGRVRTPKGFTDPLSISLAGVSEGSAIPAIEIEYNDGSVDLFPAANEDYFHQAVIAIGNAIDAAEYNESITEHVPTALLGYFDRFGRGLRDGEVLEFFPGRERPARLNRATRRRLVRASQNESLTEDVILRGTVPEIDQAKMSFELQVSGGKKITARMDAVHLETILEATAGYRAGVKISVRGVARYDRWDRLQSLELVEDAVIIDINDPLARIDELRLLKDGWLDGNGLAPSRDQLDWLAQFLSEMYPSTLAPPFIYPTESGGILLEWRNAKHDASLEIDLETLKSEFQDLICDPTNEIAFTSRLTDMDDVAELMGYLSNAFKEDEHER